MRPSRAKEKPDENKTSSLWIRQSNIHNCPVSFWTSSKQKGVLAMFSTACNEDHLIIQEYFLFFMYLYTLSTPYHSQLEPAAEEFYSLVFSL